MAGMNREAHISRADFLRKFPVILFHELVPLWNGENVLTLSERPESTHSCAEIETQKRTLIPRVDISRCLAWGQMECQLCYLACPHRDKAIEMREHKPIILAAGCDGCAMCVDACKTVNNTPAIEMLPVLQ
jgi:Pyruvate/2-oxoacid:ferredoxin oxidoreductase delta subunit